MENRTVVVEGIASELKRLESELAALSKNVENLRGALAHFESLADTPKTSQHLNEVAWDVLLAEGQPIHRKELYARLLELGVTIAGQDPVGNMTAHFSHDKRFESLGDGRWGLVAWRVPPAPAPTPSHPAPKPAVVVSPLSTRRGV